VTALFDTIDEGFYLGEIVWNDQGAPVAIRCLEQNPAAARMLGDRPDFEQYWRDIFGHTARTGRAERVQQYVQSIGVWLDCCVFKPPDAHDEVCFAVLFRDVTQERRTEETLRDVQARFASALRAAKMAAWEWDPATDTTAGSDTMSDVFGLRPGETIRSSAHSFSLVHPADRETHRALVRRAGERFEGWHTEFRIIRPRDGELAWLEQHAVVTRDPVTGRGRVTGLVWDITERKEAEQALRCLQREQERELENIRSLQAISSTIVHDADASALYVRIVRAAMALMRADMGSLQAIDPITGELVLIASEGLHPSSAQYWKRIPIRDPRRVIIPDVRNTDQLEVSGSLVHYVLSGIAAFQSTPLVTRAGRTVGVLSTHWRERHEPAETDLRSFDVLAGQVAGLLERKRSDDEIRRDLGRHFAVLRTAVDSLDDGQRVREIVGEMARCVERLTPVP
jgi:PAS domain S-box-containing protein